MPAIVALCRLLGASNIYSSQLDTFPRFGYAAFRFGGNRCVQRFMGGLRILSEAQPFDKEENHEHGAESS